jgi:general secretion pathway protein K
MLLAALRLPFAPSRASGERARSAPRRRGAPRRRDKRREGVALIIAIVTVLLLSILTIELQDNSVNHYLSAEQDRDRLRAEYMARSGVNLTRLLMSSRNQQILTTAVRPFYQMTLQQNGPSELPIWLAADEILAPFCHGDDLGESGNFELGSSPDFFHSTGRCSITAQAENAKINVSTGLHFGGDQARRNTAMQLFALLGGYHSPSPYDAIFDELDQEGQLNTRLDVVSGAIDWWDPDTDRLLFDPGSNEVSQVGAEDDIYSRYDDPYRVKNAPFDSLEELRYIRGVGDDFWATFVEPDPDDIRSRNLTVYGSGRVNINEARPEVLLARVCSISPEEQLCTNPEDTAKFIQILRTFKQQFPVPLFGEGSGFLSFLRGQGPVWNLLVMIVGPESPLLFTPIEATGQKLADIGDSLIAVAQIVTIESRGYAGCPDPAETEDPIDPEVDCNTRVRITAVVNKDIRWTPPPPNPGRMPSLGILHYYRID